MNGAKGFRESSSYGEHTSLIAIDNYILAQITSADREGKIDMELIVPKNALDGKWPHPWYSGELFSDTLYRHGVIKNKMNITIREDATINLKYGLSY